MQYYAAFNVVIMLAVLVQVATQGFAPESLWIVLVAEAIALGMGNLLAQAKLKNTYAEIFFVNEHFSLISVHEILNEQQNHAYPLLYANPAYDPEREQLTLHFNDQVVTLKREDWDDFDLIANWLYSRQL